MFHDDHENSDQICDGTKFIMASSIGPGRVTFSKCSAHHVRKHFQEYDDDGSCFKFDETLQVVPGYELEPLELVDIQNWPGFNFTPDQQCQYSFGKAYTVDYGTSVSSN